MTNQELIQWVVQITVPALAGFFGIIVGAWLTARRERTARRHEFIAQQMQSLYGPLLGLRTEIQALSELRLRIEKAADAAWHELSDWAAQMDVEHSQRAIEKRSPQFDAITAYNNKMLVEELLPRYRQMLQIFRDNIGLSRPESHPYFTRLVEYLNVWDRSLSEALPPEVLRRLGHSEEALHPLYKHIEQTVMELRSALVAGILPSR